MQQEFKPRFDNEDEDQVYTKVVKAGRRTYFFDVRSTRGNEYFLTITESRKVSGDGDSKQFDRHKIFLYKEDFDKFAGVLTEVLDYIQNKQE